MDHSVEALKPDCEIEGASGAAVTEVSAVNSPFILATNPPPETIILTEPPPEVAEWATRTLDIIVAGLLLVMVGPLMAICALATWLSGPGPLIFRQARIGRGGRPFGMIKVRSMVMDAEQRLAEITELNESDGVLFKMREDPRITRVGRFLRRYSVDELPQLVNVIRGDMSLVGPRPPLPAEVNKYAIDVHRRLLVRPGLTGLWQVSGRSGLSWDESVRLDLYYVDNWSMMTDLVIVAKTVKAVLGKSGAY